jgi:hypothetical protein
MNGTANATSRQGLMPPPQRPADKSEDRNYEDILRGTGIDIEEEARMLVKPDYYNSSAPQTPFQSQNGNFQYHNNSFGRPGSSEGAPGAQQDDGDGQNTTRTYEPTAEEIKHREEERADWEASRHSQHPLWDMFLLGGALNDRIRNISITEHLVDPQSGVLVNTQKHAPPPTVRVNGLEGASRVIDKGQAILDTGQKGERLSDIMKIISLAAKARMTGLISTSARLALERKQHSKGKVPDEWQDMAVVTKPVAEITDGLTSPAGSSSLKREFLPLFLNLIFAKQSQDHIHKRTANQMTMLQVQEALPWYWTSFPRRNERPRKPDARNDSNVGQQAVRSERQVQLGLPPRPMSRSLPPWIRKRRRQRRRGSWPSPSSPNSSSTSRPTKRPGWRCRVSSGTGLEAKSRGRTVG